MEREPAFNEIKTWYGDSFIGPEELESVGTALKLLKPGDLRDGLPQIKFSNELLYKCRDTHYLFLGVPFHEDGSNLSILSLRKIFGTDPAIQEPCFYNQDWYLKEKFVNASFQAGWYMFSKQLVEATRAQPLETIRRMSEINNNLPSAILTTYFFFVSYLYYNRPVLNHDYIWNSDMDANGDRIYVGKYTDPAGLNKNGWEIHRHLSIKTNYGALQVFD